MEIIAALPGYNYIFVGTSANIISVSVLIPKSNFILKFYFELYNHVLIQNTFFHKRNQTFQILIV